jgi:hypothetical protein
LLIASILSDLYVLWSCCGDASAEEAPGILRAGGFGGFSLVCGLSIPLHYAVPQVRWVDGGFLGLYGVCTNRQLFGHFFILFVEFEIGFAPLKGLMSVASLSTETTPDAQKGSRRSASEAKGL